MRRAMLFTVLALIVLPGLAAAQSKKYFIGIGVNKYDHNKLDNLRFAENDIVEAGQLFGDSGYIVTILTATSEPLEDPAKAKPQQDAAKLPTKANIEKALKGVLDQCKKGDIVIVAFAGHGLQFDEDTGAYFCPTDAKPFKDDKDTLISLEAIYTQLDRCGAGAKVLLADCCRNDPDPTRGRDTGEILDKTPPKGVVALFACDRSEKAFENEELKHGVFFYHLLEGLRGKVAMNADDEVVFGRLTDHIFDQVPKTVKRLTKDTKTQTPVERFAGERKGKLVLISKADGELRKDWEDYLRAGATAGPVPFIKERGLKRVGKWESSSEGSTMAMVLYARCLEEGIGVTKNEREAGALYRRAAELGNLHAMFNLGRCYENGTGVEKDAKEAVQWYTKAAEFGQPNAMNNLGNCYVNGTGVTKDEKAAVRWYTKSAELGITTGMFNLGGCYANGSGVDKDMKEAVRWYTKAAELGQPNAMNNLGNCYADGTVVTKDMKEAVRWYTKSAELGTTNAMINLGVCYANGIGVTKDEKEAVRWVTKVAELGDAAAMTILGNCYQDGIGVDKDIDKAVEWYRKAAKAGNEAAKENLKRLSKE